MKRILLAAATCVSLTASAQNAPAKKFSILGDLGNVPASDVAWVFLTYRVGDEAKTDSVQPAGGKYSFTGEMAEPTLVRLYVKAPKGSDGKSQPMNMRRSLAQVFMQPGVITVSSTDSFSNVKVKGSAAHEAFEQLKAQTKTYDAKFEELSKAYGEARKNKNEAELQKVSDQYDATRAEMKDKVYGNLIKTNPKSPIALYALSEYAGWDINASVIEPLFNKLPKEVQNTPSGKAMTASIETAKKTGIGVVAMDFTQNDTLDKPVSLSSFKGKYVLLDFWASWCGPCRMENPNVVKAFQAYKDKGFTVLGVSLDRPGAKDKWIEAIHKDNLTWTHVSDLKFWNNEVAKQYGIRAIPQNFLLDPTGKIIAKNIKGEELSKKLAEVLN